MPTTPTTLYTRAGLSPVYPTKAAELPFAIPVSTTLLKGTVVGEVTATLGTVKAYASGNVDGTQNPIGVIAYDVISDAAGLIYFGTAVGGQYGEYALTVPVFLSGYYKTAELVGLDAAALTNAKNWSLKSGTLADGVLQIG